MARETVPIPQQDTATVIEVIRQLVQAQNMRAAKQELRQLQSAIDDPTWLLLTEIANTLRFKTQDAAIAKLRNLWRRNEPHRDIIEACVPKKDEGQHIRKVTYEQRPDPSETRPVAGNVTEAYEDELGKTERDDPGTPRPELIVDRHDYDIDGAREVQFGLCVSCRLERAEMDPLTGRVLTGHGDDGLCSECRSSGRPGIPELPLGHVPLDATLARLDFLAENFGTEARGIYRQEWRYSLLSAEKGIIADWVKTRTSPDHEAAPAVETPAVTVKTHPSPVNEAAPEAKTPTVVDLNGDCTQCGEWRQLRDNLCTECHPPFGGEETPAGSVLPERTAVTVVNDRAGRKNDEQNGESVNGSVSGPTEATVDGGVAETKRRPRSRTSNESASKRPAVKESTVAAPGTGADANADRRQRAQRRQPASKPRRASGLR